MVDDTDHRAQLRQLRKDVAGDDDGLAHPAELTKDLAHLDARPRVETGCRLIQQEHDGIVDESPGQAQSLLHPARKSVDSLVAPFRQADELEQFVHNRFAAMLRLAVARGVEVKVLGNSELVVDAKEVRHVADPAVHLLRLFGDVCATDRSVSAGGFQERREYPEGRRFPGAVRPDKAEDLTFGHLKRDIVERGSLAIDLGQVFCGDHATVPVNESDPRYVWPPLIVRRSRTSLDDGSNAVGGRVLGPLAL